MFFMRVPGRVIHMECGAEMEQVYRPRQANVVQLQEKDAIVVFRKPDGTISYPGRNDKITPHGYERITLRTLHEVDAFCKGNNVVHEALDYDRGTARGHDDRMRGDSA